MNQTVLVLDFGGQYKELIARRVRENSVYSEILPGNTPVSVIREKNPIGIILTGGPQSVYGKEAPRAAEGLFELGIPVLGICYGMQLLCDTLSGAVEHAETSEYGRVKTTYSDCALFAERAGESFSLMSHTDRVSRAPEGFTVTARTANCPIAAIECKEKHLYGVQFHPEVNHTDEGSQIIRNFLYRICGATGDYDMKDYLAREIEAVRRKVGDKPVLLGLSGGVDSSVAAALLSLAVGENLTCLFVDHGLLREKEGDEVEAAFCGRKLRFVRVNAQERFLSKLAGVTDPEQKRKIVGREFAQVFEEEAKKLGELGYLAQGTIYPDVIESGGGMGNAATIKSHHNVGGLPKDLGFLGVVEPLRGLFKDEVRALGRVLGLPRAFVERQPFPGPGLSIRVMGEVTEAKLSVLRRADAIFREEMRRRRLCADQYFAVYTDVRSVGVMGDARTYDTLVVLRAVRTDDFMTCVVAPLSQRALTQIASRIVNEVPGVNRVAYDITGKPPATIEWE